MADEFIDWTGGPMPIEIGTPVVTRHRHGKGDKHSLAGEGYATRWSHTGEIDDIVAYRLERDSGAPSPATSVLPPHVRDFLGKVQGVCMGVAMSGRDHPNPDGALMELFNEAQEILFPAAATSEGSTDGH